MWDPQQYEHFRDARKRPFFELLARVPASAPRLVADLGCGTGDLTLTLAERWPGAHVSGVDSSEPMISEALRRPAPAHVRFELADPVTIVGLTGEQVFLGAGDGAIEARHDPDGTMREGKKFNPRVALTMARRFILRRA